MEKHFNLINNDEFIYDYGCYSNKKQAFSMHTHNLYEIIFFVKGDAYHIIEDRKYKLSKNDLILIQPQKYHYIEIESDKEYERFNILFNAEALGFNQIFGFKNFSEVISLSSNKIAVELFSKMQYYHTHLNKADFENVAIMLLKELFFNLSISAIEVKKDFSTLTPVLSSALFYINENLFTISTIKEVAEKLFVTQSYLFRLFKQELKTTPKKYLTDKRLLCAQNLILLGNSPTKVYTECGWNDYTSFFRSYVKYFNHPPSQEGN